MGLTILTLLFSCSKEDEIKKVFKASDLTFPADKYEVTKKSITLEWKKNEDPSAKYDVFIATKEELTDAEKIKSALVETKCTVEELIPSSTYFWKVKSTNTAGESIDSKVFSFTTASEASALKSPADKATIDGNSVSLEWNKNSDVNAKYDVFLGTNAELTDAEKIATGITDVTFLAKELISGYTYFWKVKTIDSAGKTLESSVFTFTPALNPSALLLPEDKSVIAENSVSLSWAKNSNPNVKYDVFIGNKAELTDDDRVVTKTSDLSYLAEGIKAGATCYWKVNTISDKGAVLETTSYSFSNKYPSTPVQSYPKDKAELIRLTTNLLWSESTLFDGAEVTYNILYAPTADFESKPVKTADLTKTKLSIEGLTENTSYSWKVIARNADGDTTESEVFTFTTHKSPANTLLLPANESTGTMPASLTWEVEDGFTYSVYLSKDPSGFTPGDEMKKDITNGEFNLTNIDQGVTYYWQIRAFNAVGTEFVSKTFSFTTPYLQLSVKEGTFVDKDGHSYKTTIINGTEWLAENYAFIPTDESLWMIPGKSVGDPAYNDVANDANYKKYGLIYSIDAITPFIPEGWHVATDEDWNTLEVIVGMPKDDIEMTGYRGAHAPALRNDDGSWVANALNTVKMNLLPAGFAGPNWSAPGFPCSKITDFETKAWIWTATAKADKAFYRMISNNDTSLTVRRYFEKPSRLMSVRLVKNK